MLKILNKVENGDYSIEEMMKNVYFFEWMHENYMDDLIIYGNILKNFKGKIRNFLKNEGFQLKEGGFQIGIGWNNSGKRIFEIPKEYIVNSDSGLQISLIENNGQ